MNHLRVFTYLRVLTLYKCLNGSPSWFHLVCLQFTCVVYLCCILVLYHVCVSLTCVVAVYMCVHVCCRFASTVALIQRRFVFCRLRNLCYWAAMSTLAHLVNLLLHKNLHNCFLNKRKLVHVFGFEPIFLATCFWCFLLFLISFDA